MTLPHIARVPIPARMARLPLDKRGYPIPWNTATGKGNVPLFIINDTHRHLAALEFELCGICSDPLDRVRWFVGGPGSAFHPDGWYQDLPLHHECAHYALAVCPWLALPVYTRRIDVVDPSKLTPDLRVLFDPTHDPDRPALFVAIGSQGTEIGRQFSPYAGSTYIRPTKPYVAVEYWQHGQQLTQAAAHELIRTDWPGWTPPTFAG